ncbi:MAG: amidohydrolase family protein, partial [Woeseiaceae bacterium]
MRNLLLLLSITILVSCSPSDERAGADLVLTNGNIVTVDPVLSRAEAVAVIDGRIEAVGGSAEIAAYIGENTEVIDLAGQTAVPGLIEGHGHYTSFGGSLLILDFRHAASFAEIVSMVGDAARETPDGEWIIGRGWHQDKWQTKEDVLVEGLPTHASLSAVTPDHPVMLIHTSGHAVFVNQKAMTLVELTDSST